MVDRSFARDFTVYKTYDDHGKSYYLHCVVARERLLFWVENKTLNRVYCCEVLFLAVIKEFSVLLEMFPVSLHRNHLIVDTQWFNLIFEVEFEFMYFYNSI